MLLLMLPVHLPHVESAVQLHKQVVLSTEADVGNCFFLAFPSMAQQTFSVTNKGHLESDTAQNDFFQSAF